MDLPAPAIACLLIVTFCYVVLCAVSPFARCRRCQGFGFAVTHGRFTGRVKRGRDCRRCDATGARIRIGRHLWILWRRTYRDGTR